MVTFDIFLKRFCSRGGDLSVGVWPLTREAGWTRGSSNYGIAPES